MIRQGYNFDGVKTRELKAKLDACRRDPDYARALFGLKAKGRRK